MMEYYSNFARLFYECFHDHVEEIYEVFYKNNEYYGQEEREREKERKKERERDAIDKCYEYSLTLSFPKSRSLNREHSK
jgi:hypothetical protein